MTARLLTILTLALPLTACAAQPGSGQAPAAAPAVTTAAEQHVRAAEPAAPVPATVQADSARQDTRTDAQHDAAPRRADAGGHEAANGVTAPAASNTRRATAPATSTRGNSAAGTSATGTSASGTATPPAPAGDTSATATPANDTATAATGATPPAAPDVAAPRPTAPAATVPPVTMPAGSSTGSLLQTLFALILVLAVLGALAWFLKRYGPKVGGGNANVRVVGSLNLGGRERIVVVEVGNEWIVVGASPGRINALATMPRQDAQHGDHGGTNAALAPHSPAAHSFADWLKQTIDKRK